VLTKYVITPVKMNVKGLSEILDSYEKELVESKIMPLIPESWRDELRHMVYEPFTNLDGTYNRNGRAIKACDNLAAYMEAHISMCYGISSKSLRDGEAEIKKKLLGQEYGMDVKSLVEEIDAKDI
jgi:putative hydrolase of HD superfamily